ncbi:Outer-membrane-phospholipid-binding lipoprotein MlaA [hydrothermal vent metagenome]|uniref:Outer-membrane-phospholipid-binding lipoprotein MlaA n=1 Tax=hydrothermal vent metagenome TaxID=652676 RepID=A0A3B1BFU6_9ZZZZ
MPVLGCISLAFTYAGDLCYRTIMLEALAGGRWCVHNNQKIKGKAMIYKRFSRQLGVLLLASSAMLAGCATTNSEYDDPRDPLEGYNRFMYEVNDTLDGAIIKPLSQGYKAILPAPIDRGITNVFNNLDDLTSIINNILQFKLDRAISDIGRVLVNSTAGVLGLIDIASDFGMPRHNEDFGQTLGHWGVGPGPYFVLPILGDSTIRDSFGLVADWYVDPLRQIDGSDARWGLVGLRGVDHRADLLSASRVLEEAALDPYEFGRDAYLQKRRNDVHDNNPPAETDP